MRPIYGSRQSLICFERRPGWPAAAKGFAARDARNASSAKLLSRLGRLVDYGRAYWRQAGVEPVPLARYAATAGT